MPYNQPEQKEQKKEEPVVYVPRGRIKNLASRTAIKTAARTIGSFLATNPWVWGMLAIIIITLITFVIVVSGVAPGAPQDPTMPPPEP